MRKLVSLIEYLILENPEQTGSWNHIPGDGEGKKYENYYL